VTESLTEFASWTRHEGVAVVECPSCGFCMDADHEDMSGGYSCPVCAEMRLRAENERLRRELRLPGPNPPEGYFDV